MNITKRQVNVLKGRTFRYNQSENADLLYVMNWGPAYQGTTISTSTWTVENGSVTLSSEANSTTTTQVIITGSVGEATITNKVVLADGQTDERIIKLKIIDNYDPAINDDYGLGDC